MPYCFGEIYLRSTVPSCSYLSSKCCHCYGTSSRMNGSGQHNLLIKQKISYHYGDVIMGAIASQVTSLTIVYSSFYSEVDQRKHQSSASLAFVRGIHRGPVNSPHKWSVTRKMFSFDDVIMSLTSWIYSSLASTLGANLESALYCISHEICLCFFIAFFVVRLSVTLLNVIHLPRFFKVISPAFRDL